MSKLIETTIEIYGQTFTLRTDPEEEKELKRVAAEVNDFLRHLSRRGTVAIHRLALMAAFQYAYELDVLKSTAGPPDRLARQITKRLDKILLKLQAALEEE